ncbi:MAG TPA: extracellular solute-binding protein [Xanthobacteraceae bacterium]|nr:extracellular solute-binding protein [Xanthobacteraceae bacterium]
MDLSRRTLIHTGLLSTLAPALERMGLPVVAPASAQATTQGSAQAAGWKHALSLFGDINYPAGFEKFDYVNANAPKTGSVRMSALGAFDNFNMVVAGVRGSIVASLELIYDTLMVRSLDEVTTVYGLLAEAVTHPADFSAVTYRLRAGARWHDGKPVTVEDVIYSFEMLVKHHPAYSGYYRHVTKTEKTADREVTFTFDAPGNRELPLIVGELTVLPKHWWEGNDASGKKRDIGATTLEPPLGCGAYRIKEFTAGRNVVYERVKDYWGHDLNVNRGRDNFDEIRVEYFRDPTVALEAFRGDQIDFRFENSALYWATRYDFPARNEKRVLLEEFQSRSRGVMQGFVFNTRRDKFKDARLRRAFNYVFDFEEANKQFFFGQYKRVASYFEGTELAWHGSPDDAAEEKRAVAIGSRGRPEGLELAILEPLRGQVPAEVFTTPYVNPVGGGADAGRTNLREALRLAREAGYEVRNQKLVNTKTGEALSVEFLIGQGSAAFERVILFYKQSLERLGVTVAVRTVDEAQYENRLRNWDYDIIIHSWGESLSPGNEQRDRWGAPAADQVGSQNYAGIKNPAVDALIDRVIFAKSRDELVAATHALDRVLIWNFYVVPQWTYGKVRTARWDRYGRPDELPKYGDGAFPTVWWWDGEKAARTRGRS